MESVAHHKGENNMETEHLYGLDLSGAYVWSAKKSKCNDGPPIWLVTWAGTPILNEYRSMEGVINQCLNMFQEETEIIEYQKGNNKVISHPKRVIANKVSVLVYEELTQHDIRFN